MRKLLLVLVAAVFSAMLAACGSGGDGSLAPKSLGFTPQEIKENLSKGDLGVHLPESRFEKDKDGNDVFTFSYNPTGIFVGGVVDSTGRVHTLMASIPWPAVSLVSNQQMAATMSGILRATNPELAAARADQMVAQMWNELPQTSGANPNEFVLDGKVYASFLQPFQGQMRAYFGVCVIGVEGCKVPEANTGQ